MPVYRYQVGSGAAGGPAAGIAVAFRTIEAQDRGAAVRAIVQRGESPTRIEEMTDEPGGSMARPAEPQRFRGLSGPVMNRSEVSALVRDLGIAVNAGLPLIAALRTIARQGRKAPQKLMMESLIAGVEAGDPLSDAMQAFGRPFNELMVSLVRAGEAAGRLGETLRYASELLERDLKLRRQVTGALIYPAILGVLIVLAVVVVVTFVVPRVLAAVASNGGIELPWPTMVVQNMAMFFANWWWLVLGGLAVGIWAFARALRDAAFRLSFDSFLLGLPLVGPMLRDVAVARFTRTLGTLVGAGLPVLNSLRITRAVLGNKAMEVAMDRVSESVSAGSTIAEPLEQSGLFPSLLVQIVGLGEKTGKLDEMLMQAAGAFEEKTEQTVKLVTTILPPLLIVVMAMAVGFIVISILLPLLELQEAASRAV